MAEDFGCRDIFNAEKATGTNPSTRVHTEYVKKTVPFRFFQISICDCHFRGRKYLPNCDSVVDQEIR